MNAYSKPAEQLFVVHALSKYILVQQESVLLLLIFCNSCLECP